MQGWRVAWHHAPKAYLLRIDMREAARVDGAVLRFARTGEGDVEWIEGSRSDFRLYVPPYVVTFEIFEEERVLKVWGLNRALR